MGPAPTEVEVSLFGPGFGECSVLHIGDGRWMVVDSCIDPQTGEPAALSYLRSLGVRPECVELIVATHWHDDHVRGISALVRSYPDARVCVPGILTNAELVASIIAHDARPLTRVTSGVAEMRRLLEAKAGGTLIRGIADRRLLAFEAGHFSHGHPVEVWALSPCDASLQRFLGSLQRYIPREGMQKQRVPNITPNECSVVISVSVGPLGILLGADLEEETCSGWSAILASHGRPSQLASFFKVPHHGSKNAHHPDVWRHLLVPNALFALAPYNRGAKLPSRQDVQRLASLSDRGYSTAPLPKKAARRVGTVGKIIKEFNVQLAPMTGVTGQVRARASNFEEGTFSEVELFSGARPLLQVHGS